MKLIKPISDPLQKEYGAQNQGIAPDEKRSVLEGREHVRRVQHRSPSLTTSLDARRSFTAGLSILLSLFSILSSITCWAETTQTITITGKLIPDPCTVTFEDPDIKLGDISRKNLENSEHTIKIKILCPANSSVKLQVQDTLASSSSKFNLKSKQLDQVLGHYAIFPINWAGLKQGSFDPTMLDGTKLQLVTEDGVHTESVEKTGLVSGKSYVFALAQSVNHFQGNRFNGELKIKMLPMTEPNVEGEIHGSAVVTFIHP